MANARSPVADIVAGEIAQLEITKGTDVGTAQPDPTNDMRVVKPRPCVACKQHHKGVGALINCLEASLVEKREEASRLSLQVNALRTAVTTRDTTIAALNDEVRPVRELRTAVANDEATLGPSWVEKLRRGQKKGE